jgi:hypothetical protein
MGIARMIRFESGAAFLTDAGEAMRSGTTPKVFPFAIAMNMQHVGITQQCIKQTP